MNAAFLLLRLLEQCNREGLPEPKGTRSIVADAQLCEVLAKRLDVPFEVAQVFEGVPVKEARSVASWSLTVPLEERIGALRSWRRKRESRFSFRRAS
jgi:hypothetical protein